MIVSGPKAILQIGIALEIEWHTHRAIKSIKNRLRCAFKYQLGFCCVAAQYNCQQQQYGDCMYAIARDFLQFRFYYCSITKESETKLKRDATFHENAFDSDDPIDTTLTLIVCFLYYSSCNFVLSMPSFTRSQKKTSMQTNQQQCWFKRYFHWI